MSDRSKKDTAPGDATWDVAPTSGDWNTAANWDPNQVPAGTATFDASSRTQITFAPGSSAAVGGIVFASDASAFAFTFAAPAPNAPALTITGAGVANGSGNTQYFIVQSSATTYKQPQLKFMNTASAGGGDVSYAVGPSSPTAAGGGVLGFYDQSTAGSASFTVTTGAGTPVEPSTVGGEVSFSEQSNAGTATFTIYGSTSTTDGDTFGNVVFHDTASAAKGSFTNIGGTVAGGDGGNTQFYDNAVASNGQFHNLGGSVAKANGGDVAFDGTANARSAEFLNYAATASGGYGGVTSFNNNPPALAVSTQGASAGAAMFRNYGATGAGQGGGHTYFTAKYGSPTAATGVFVNHGSAVAGSDSCAGHTVFSISVPQKVNYTPSAGNGAFWNFGGVAAGAPGGYTEFTVYSNDNAATPSGNAPTAAYGYFYNVGANVEGASGGKTVFAGNSTAASAQLYATGGTNGGYGGAIVFYGQASGGGATVRLSGNGTLDVSGYGQPTLTILSLELGPGCIRTTLGTSTPCVAVASSLTLVASTAAFSFASGNGFATNTWYTILTAPNLSDYSASQFTGNSLGSSPPTFRIVGNSLRVSFSS